MTDCDVRASGPSRTEQVAVADLATFAREPARVSGLGLGSFSQAGALNVVSRRTLLTLGLPPPWLRAAAPPLTGGWHTGWTRWLGDYTYWHTVRQQLGGSETWRQLVRGPTILLYHAIGSPDEPPSRFVLPIRRFEQHMRWLRGRRYHVLSLEALLDYWQRGYLPPPRSVVVTLDDAYADACAHAFPALARLQIPRASSWSRGGSAGAMTGSTAAPSPACPLATAQQLSMMRDGGMRLGAHSRTHPSLPRISREQAEDEIVGSRADFEQLFGSPERRSPTRSDTTRPSCRDLSAALATWARATWSRQ